MIAESGRILAFDWRGQRWLGIRSRGGIQGWTQDSGSSGADKWGPLGRSDGIWARSGEFWRTLSGFWPGPSVFRARVSALPDGTVSSVN